MAGGVAVEETMDAVVSNSLETAVYCTFSKCIHLKY